MSPEPVNELEPPLPGGRLFTLCLQPGLGDCTSSGRMRLDAIARWLQDVAYRDVEQAGLQDEAVWVLRRTRIKVLRFPRFAERCEVITYCSGVGRMWSERRTTIRAADRTLVEAVAVWVHLEPETLHPFKLTEAELSVYGGAAGGRQIHAHLRHPKPDPDAAARDWSFRLTDVDVADHVNNAVYWEAVEEELLAAGDVEPAVVDIELEHRAPAQPGLHAWLAAGDHRWLTSPDQSEVFASVAIIDETWQH